MGMPCQVNSILKLTPAQGYPTKLELGTLHRVQKEGYRIFPLDVPLCLVDETWLAHADITIKKLTWEHQTTYLEFSVSRVYTTPFPTQ
ncbi:MAG: DUF2584 family protein [Cyanobacteria bacterium J06638_6]